MNLLKKTQNICRDNHISPARSRGQNFLINEKVYDDIIEASDINKDDIILEVGPGLGFLTEKLAEKAKKVIAIELDDKLAEVLKKRLEKQGIKNVEIINMNVLDFDIEKYSDLKSQISNLKYKIVANLPYNITSVFLRKFLTAQNKPQSFVLMLQKEVAERIAAKPGKMSLLAVSVQIYAKPQIVQIVSSVDFWPAPKVDSAVIKIDNVLIPNIDEKKIFQLIKFGFSSKRKMLKNNLAGAFRMEQSEVEKLIKQAGFNEKVRAQELSVEDWYKLAKYFA